MKNKNILIDTHAHVNFNDFKDDYKETTKRALNNEIWMINIGAGGDTSKRAIEIAEEYENGIYAAVGLHPGGREEFDYDYFFKLAKNEKVVGIGECGLDYYHTKDIKLWEKQKEIFIKHIKLANETNKPLIIHCRDAHDDLLEILRLKAKLPKGVMHFFTGTLEQAKKYIDLDFNVSFSGVITFTSAYNEVVKNIPLEKILVETDCPFVAPVPYRGKRNEPAYVKYVAQKIAELRGLSFDEVAEQTTRNARKLFVI